MTQSFVSDDKESFYEILFSSDSHPRNHESSLHECELRAERVQQYLLSKHVELLQM